MRHLATVFAGVGLLALGFTGCQQAPTSLQANAQGGPAGNPGAASQSQNGAAKAPLYESNDYDCVDGATNTDGPTFGFAVMNKNADGEVIVEVSVKNGNPNSTYDIFVNQVPENAKECGTDATAQLTTNRQGNGNVNVKEAAVDGAEHFWVSAWDGEQSLRSTSVELDSP